MKTNRLLTSIVAAVALSACLFVLPAEAGSSSSSKAGIEKFGETVVRQFALKVNDTLESKKVNLAIIARSGRPRSELPAGVSYTHVAIVVFEPVKASDGTIGHTYTVYNLYQGDQGRDNRSYLAQDFTYDFVAGSAERDVAVFVPIDPLQARILTVIRSPAYKGLHNADYNLVANPWKDRFDNCVTHTLKICVAAIYETDDRGRIYENLRSYFKPTPIQLGLLQSFGSTFMSAISREDMDPKGLQTASYGSLKDFFEQNGLVKEAFSITLD